jgi:hypothetical protein
MAVGREDGSEANRSLWIVWGEKRLNFCLVASFGICYRKLRDSNPAILYVKDKNRKIPCLKLWKSGRYYRNRYQEIPEGFPQHRSKLLLSGQKSSAISSEAIKIDAGHSWARGFVEQLSRKF